MEHLVQKMKTTVKRGLVLRYLIPGLLLSEEEQRSGFRPGQTAPLAGTACGVWMRSRRARPREETGLGGAELRAWRRPGEGGASAGSGGHLLQEREVQ